MKPRTKKALLITGGTVVTVGILSFLLRKPHPKIDTTSLQNARQLGIDLGTAFDIWDPLSWSENDQAAEDLIISIPQSQIPQLEKDYMKLYNRNLAADLQLKLDGWNNVKNKFTTNSNKGGALNKALLKIKKL